MSPCMIPPSALPRRRIALAREGPQRRQYGMSFVWHRRVLAVAAAAALASIAVERSARATSPPTIYDNAQPYPLGSRAAGMGGSYTALACDEAALHYNPAALGCARDSRLELAANVYMLQHFDVPNAIGPGEGVTAT